MKTMKQQAREHLYDVILPFWKGLKDDTYGGYYGYLDYDLTLDKKATKGCILNSRILWFFANAAKVLKDDSLIPYAEHAYRFLTEKCFDRENGGIYWALAYDGTPEDTTKHTYNQAFAIYALSSYYDLTKDEAALAAATELYNLIESRMKDEIGYLEAFDRAFVPVDNDKLSENGVIAHKTMNTLLHVFEAYTELYKVTGREEVKNRILWMLDVIENKIYNKALERQEVFFDANMNSIIDLHSYGHDIETAWLVDRALDVIGDRAVTARIRPINATLTKKIYNRAYRNHSLLNECECGVDNTLRIWWVQAEAVVGFLNGYQKNPGHLEYLAAAEDIFGTIMDKLWDRRAGSEWYWCLDEELRPVAGKPIVEPWKCPYHNGRMCFEILSRDWIHPKYYEELAKQEELLNRKNVPSDAYNGIFTRYQYPVLTREMTPLTWRYDLNAETNPFFMERLAINATMNSGAIKFGGKYYLVVRTEGNDRKSFFSLAESDNGIDGFRFVGKPILLEDTCKEETNVYDMRLTKHEDGYIYGVFCSESKDTTVNDLSAAVAAAGIVRTKDLVNWERLPNLKTLHSPQQRNVVLHPEFVNGKYAFYTRPMDDFIDTGSGGGIGFGLCDDICNAVIDEEIITSQRKYHTITEVKNGAGAVPIKSERGWLHVAHGVRNTAAGLRYVLYAFATDLEHPEKVIAEPSGMLLGPHGWERVGDVSNVVFTNGAIVDDNDDVLIYYASSDTRMHVAKTTLAQLEDFIFNTPEDPLRSVLCVQQRCELIDRNEELLNRQ